MTGGLVPTHWPNPQSYVAGLSLDLEMIAAALLVLASALLAWTDLRSGTIPDWLNFSIGGLGLARVATLIGWEGVLAAAVKAVTVGFIVWSLRLLYFRVRKHHGLGLGDVKLLAASAVWIGIVGVPIQLLIASLTALVAAAFLWLAGHPMTRQTSLPFGPFLALGLLTTLALQEVGLAG